MHHRSIALFVWTLIAASPSVRAQGVAVPVRLVEGLPVVTVSLGAAKADFLLDTGSGAALTVARPLITPSAGVTELPATIKTTDASGAVHEVHRLQAKAVALGTVQLGTLDGLVHYRWGLNIGSSEAPAVTQLGTLGRGALEQHGVLFELGQGRLTLFKIGERPVLDGGWFSTPFVLDKRGVVVRFTAHGRAAELVLDSAATTSLMKKGSPALIGPNDACQGQPADTPACGPTRFTQGAIGNDSTVDASFVVVAMGPLPFDGLLGIDFFTTHAIYLDFAHREMYFKRTR